MQKEIAKTQWAKKQLTTAMKSNVNIECDCIFSGRKFW